MKVSVDEKRCQGHARCVAFAAQVFFIDDEGFSHVREGFETVAPELENYVKKAFANCPENAILISD